MRFTRKLRFSGLLLACVLIGLAASVTASGPFVEPDVAVIHAFTGEQVGDSFGWVAENLDDVNGDGVNDFITSAPFYSIDGTTLEGKIYIYSGADGALLHTAVGSGFELFGYSASRAGDVNGDGITDYTSGGPAASHAVVYSGADNSVLLDLNGQGGDSFGASVGQAGDVNGDGYGDVIVGATAASVSFPGAGRVYVFSGQDGSVIWTHDGHRQGSRLGSAVGHVGDVDGDGVADQVAGSTGAGEKGRGEAYVFSGASGDIIYTLTPVGLPGNFGTFGQFFASGAGDVDNDGTPDIYVADYAARHGNVSGTGRAYVFSGADGSRLRVFNAENKGDGLGPGRGVGDVNGDGYGDLVIGAYLSSEGAPTGGKVYVYSGKNGRALRTITGTIAGDWLGAEALGIGDVNGDGLVDYLLSAYGNSYTVTGLSNVYVIAGTP